MVKNFTYGKVAIALSAITLVLTGCTPNNTSDAPNVKAVEKPVIEQNIETNHFIVSAGISELPDGWKYSMINGDSKNLAISENGSCSVKSSSAKVPYSGLGLGDSFVTNTYIQDTYSQFKDIENPILGKIDLKQVLDGKAEFLTYEFDAKRNVSHTDEPSLKQTRNFVAVRGFDSPVEEEGSKWSSVVAVEGYCTDAKDYNKDEIQKIIEAVRVDEVIEIIEQ